MTHSLLNPTRRAFLAGTAALGGSAVLGIRPASAAVNWKNTPARRSKSISSKARAAKR